MKALELMAWLLFFAMLPLIVLIWLLGVKDDE